MKLKNIKAGIVYKIYQKEDNFLGTFTNVEPEGMDNINFKYFDNVNPLMVNGLVIMNVDFVNYTIIKS